MHRGKLGYYRVATATAMPHSLPAPKAGCETGTKGAWPGIHTPGGSLAAGAAPWVCEQPGINYSIHAAVLIYVWANLCLLREHISGLIFVPHSSVLRA